MLDWYQQEIVAPGRQPVFLSFVAFLVTLIATRAIVRMIRAGKGPFGNVSTGDVHVHHVVPGIVLMGIGGLIGLSASGAGMLKNLAGILFGMGCALVLDEFALILHLDDVYWEKEGRLSIEATSLALIIMLMAVTVAAPNNQELPPELDTPATQWAAAGLFVLFWVFPVGVTLLKGKLFTAAIAIAGIGIVFAWVGAIRVAKPGSPWARARYAPEGKKMAKAQRRLLGEQRRMTPIRNGWARLVYGFDGSEKSIKEGGRQAVTAPTEPVEPTEPTPPTATSGESSAR